MLEGSFRPCEHTFAALLKSCAKLKDLEKGKNRRSQVQSFGEKKEGECVCGGKLVKGKRNVSFREEKGVRSVERRKLSIQWVGKGVAASK